MEFSRANIVAGVSVVVALAALSLTGFVFLQRGLASGPDRRAIALQVSPALRTNSSRGKGSGRGFRFGWIFAFNN